MNTTTHYLILVSPVCIFCRGFWCMIPANSKYLDTCIIFNYLSGVVKILYRTSSLTIPEVSRERFPVVLRALLRWVEHVIDHGSDHIVVLDTFELDTLRADNNTLEEWMGRPVNPSHLTILEVINLHNELKVRGVGVETAVATEEELDHVATFGTCDHSGRLIATELDLVLDSLRLDVSVVQRVRYDRIRCLCHLFFSIWLINYKEYLQMESTP